MYNVLVEWVGERERGRERGRKEEEQGERGRGWVVDLYSRKRGDVMKHVHTYTEIWTHLSPRRVEL